jgi:hypothetical protein
MIGVAREKRNKEGELKKKGKKVWKKEQQRKKEN